MKIAIVSGDFYPHISPRSFRTTELAQELCRLGHDVTVFIPETDFDYSSFFEEYPMTVKFYHFFYRTKFSGISLVDRIILRILNQFFAYHTSCGVYDIFKSIKGERGYDLLISIAYPHSTHWAVAELYKRGHRIASKWIADCGDPFMKAISSKYHPPFYFGPIEKKWCRSCDYISVPTDTSYLGYYEEFHSKIVVIPQGFRLDSDALPGYKPNDVVTFAYAGSFYTGFRDPHMLFEFLGSIEKPFLFYIYGNNDSSRWTDVLHNLENKVVFVEPKPRAELLQVLARMDFLVNIGNGTNVQTPSKLIDYSLTGRPVLTIEHDDVREDVWGEFLEGDYSHADAPVDVSKYDIHNVARQFLELYHK